MHNFSRRWLLLVLVYLAGVASLQAEDVTTGSALQELGSVPPAPPKGYANSAAVIIAAQTGKLKIVQTAAAASVREQTDLEYGRVGTRSLHLDLYSPADLQEPVPGIIMIHGGAWKGGRKEDYAVYGRRLAALGYVVASIDYRLSAEAKFPAAVQDSKCAVRWMRANAAELHVKPDAIGVGGGSAGGHLAMMVGYCDAEPELEGTGGHATTSSRVQCVINLYGPYDLTTDFVRKNPFSQEVCKEFLGSTIEQDLELYQRASPFKHVTADDPPTLILHGTVDDIVPVDQSDLLAARLKEINVPYIYDRLPGWPHAMDLSQDVNDRCVWFMDRFLARYLKQRLPE